MFFPFKNTSELEFHGISASVVPCEDLFLGKTFYVIINTYERQYLEIALYRVIFMKDHIPIRPGQTSKWSLWDAHTLIYDAKII